MPGPRKSTATFSSGVVKSTCQGALDECSGGTIPDVGSLAQTLMTATQNPEWNTAQVKKKILLWLEKHVTTADDELLHRWWSSTARTNDEWTEAIKNQTTLEKFLEGLDQGSNLPEGHVKVPFTVARLRFKAWQEWIKKSLKRDQRNREKASNSAAQAEKDAAQRQHSHIRCRLCDCEAKRSQGGGRMLENIVVCSRHNGQTPIAQLFPKNGSGKLVAVRALCGQMHTLWLYRAPRHGPDPDTGRRHVDVHTRARILQVYCAMGPRERHNQSARHLRGVPAEAG